MTLYTCPVLAFTPAVDDVLGWFDLTYEIEVGFGWMQWRLASLPYTGGVADQPAKLMQALAFVARLRNMRIAEDLKRQRRGPTEKRRTRRG